MNLWTKAGLAAGTARGGIIVGGFDSEGREGCEVGCAGMVSYWGAAHMRIAPLGGGTYGNLNGDVVDSVRLAGPAFRESSVTGRQLSLAKCSPNCRADRPVLT